MARVDHLTGGIYRISTYAPEKRISFNQFLIDDDEPALIHTGTFPMYADVRSAITQVLDPVSEFDRWFLPRPSKRPLLVV